MTAAELEDLARRIAGLYNNSLVAPAALMFGNAGPPKLGINSAAHYAYEALNSGTLHLDYLRGHLMKVSIIRGKFDSFMLYDRDNGKGAAQRAMEDGLTDPAYNADWEALLAELDKEKAAKMAEAAR